MTVIYGYLRDILQCIDRILEYTRDGRDSFLADPKTQDAVARNFEIIGEVVKRLPTGLLQAQPHIPWRAIAGFRDILIHDYGYIDLEEVWLTIERDVMPLKKAVQALLDSLPADEEPDMLG